MVAEARRAASCLEGGLSKTEVVDGLFADDLSDAPPHIGCLDGSLKPAVVMEAVVADTRRVVKTLTDHWVADLQGLCTLVSENCPQWQAFSMDASFLTKERIKAFLTNPGYPKLTPSCNLIGEMVEHLLKLGHSGPLVDASVVKTAQEIRRLGYDTVSFTFALYQAVVVIPKMTTVAQRAKAVAETRAALRAKDFRDIPVSLEGKLAALAGEPVSEAPAAPVT